jgi:hypothetical protein
MAGRLIHRAARRYYGSGCLAGHGATEIEVAKFEDWDAAGRISDAVSAAKAWHRADRIRPVACRRLEQAGAARPASSPGRLALASAVGWLAGLGPGEDGEGLLDDGLKPGRVSSPGPG